MKTGLFQIAIVLDRSGSMGSIKDATIEAFNGLLDAQKASGDDINLLLVQFDSQGPHDIVFDGQIKDFGGLNEDNYEPRGGTPLHDAMGWTINALGDRLSKLPEDERPSKVMVVILTDGHENASQEFDGGAVARLIKHQTDVYKWTFIFLGANQDAVLTARQYNIYSGAASTFDPSAVGTRSVVNSTNSIVDLWKYSNEKYVPEFTDEDRKKAMAGK